MSVTDLAAKLEGIFTRHSEIVAAFVFGSVGRGSAGPLSDVDITVLLDEAVPVEESGYGYLADLTAELIHVLHRNDVDLIVLNTAPPYLSIRCYAGAGFCSAAPVGHLAEFRLRAFNEYQDWLPFLAVQRRYLSSRLKTGEFGKKGRVVRRG